MADLKYYARMLWFYGSVRVPEALVYIAFAFVAGILTGKLG